jgi:CheY-like chemotaxis protein
MIAPLDRCLIVEENFLIRQDLADMLQSLGFRQVDEAESNAQAMALIATTAYRMAFIYILHADDGNQSLAAALRDMNIPFVVTTAHLEARDLPAVMKDAPVVSKPYSFVALRRILASL